MKTALFGHFDGLTIDDGGTGRTLPPHTLPCPFAQLVVDLQIRQGRRHLEHQCDRLTDAYQAGVLPLAEYQQRRQVVEEQTASLKYQAQQIASQVEQHKELAGVLSSIEAFCQRISAGLAGATFAQQRQLVELLIDRVIVTNAAVEIRYVLLTSSRSEHIRCCHLRTNHLDEDISASGRQARIANWVQSQPDSNGLIYIPGFATQAVIEEFGFDFQTDGRFGVSNRRGQLQNRIVIANGESRGISLDAFREHCSSVAKHFYQRIEQVRADLLVESVTSKAMPRYS